MTYVVKHVELANGERQVLIDEIGYIPPVLPNLYFAGIYNQAYRTKCRRARNVVLLLNWASDHKIDLFDRIKSGEGLTYAEQASLATRLRYKLNPKEDDLYLSASTFMDRCREVKSFLHYLMNRFRDTRLDKDSYVAKVGFLINDLFDFLSGQKVNTLKVKREGFSHVERMAMMELVHPLSNTNPFQSRVRERNWLIINILYQTGIRTGELLSLRCNAVQSEFDIAFGMTYFLLVSHNVFLHEDPRTLPPDAKTNSRLIPISEGLAMQIDHYIKTGRKYRKREAQKAAPYLFLNSSKHPAPLSISGLGKMLNRIEKVGNTKKLVFSSIEAHRFRYSTFEDFARVLEMPIESEKFKKVMRYMGGWSKTSNQHELYADKEIRFLAHLALQKLHEEFKVY
ncbi:hypothetical protein ACFO3I_02765 [Rheinheimera marina]|uniref:Tyr recombinase domain-containing protein n=1 Tax=Rheinheimera marina TaxID=1774958 RepID=A0ABV9JGY1_9GAMM